MLFLPLNLPLSLLNGATPTSEAHSFLFNIKCYLISIKASDLFIPTLSLESAGQGFLFLPLF
jgi:hypothetical protein